MITVAKQLIGQVYDADVAEAYAILHGLLLMPRMDCNRVMVNSYFMEVITMLQLQDISYGRATTIFDECRGLTDDLIVVSFDFYSRESNYMAHKLAKRPRFAPTVFFGYMSQRCSLIPIFLTNDVLVFL